MKKLISLILVLCLLILGTIPALAETMPDNPEGTTTSIGTDDDMNHNRGTITLNNGLLLNNYGTVQENVHQPGYDTEVSGKVMYNSGTIISNGDTYSYGYVTTNNSDGVIQQNLGTVGTNRGEIDYMDSYGEVDDNYGTVKANEGIVKNNYGEVTENSGTVSTNTEDGTVTTNNASVVTNNGQIDTNNSTATVSTNNGSITNNAGITETNKGTIAENSGRVSTNDDIITENTGKVGMNNGVVSTNAEGGTVITSSEDASVFANEGTIKTNLGSVITNSGTIDENRETGAIMLNMGTVSDNDGEVMINGGTVYNSETGVVDTNLGTMIEADGTTYVGTVINDAKGEGDMTIEQYIKDSVHNLKELFKRKGFVVKGYSYKEDLTDENSQDVVVDSVMYTAAAPNNITILWKKTSKSKSSTASVALYYFEKQTYKYDTDDIILMHTSSAGGKITEENIEKDVKVRMEGRELEPGQYTIMVDADSNITMELSEEFYASLAAGSHSFEIVVRNIAYRATLVK